MNVEEIEATLIKQVEIGLITQTEMVRFLKRASGGVYLDEQDKALFEVVNEKFMHYLDSLHSLGIISDARINSTRTKTRTAIAKAIGEGKITRDGELNEEE
tara:strand:+ start:1152 stop:1454 length:303 start_codon:yes stop_codon:yes gene_type:complete